MAEPIVSLFQWNQEGLETMIAGAIGGLFLCLGRFIATVARVDGQTLKMKQFVLAHIPALIIFWAVVYRGSQSAHRAHS
jgi:uncharacterized membrane protein YeaQ/YmgE (transglycosylase-associated protein family)